MYRDAAFGVFVYWAFAVGTGLASSYTARSVQFVPSTDSWTLKMLEFVHVPLNCSQYVSSVAAPPYLICTVSLGLLSNLPEAPVSSKLVA